MYKKMLVPLDGSRLAEITLPYAKEIAGRFDLKLVLFHVCEPREAGAHLACQSYIENTAGTLQEESREIQSKTGAATSIKPVEVQAVLKSGYPAEEIIKYVENTDIDFILMATHGFTGIKRWLIGSVADKVLRRSPVPVWLIRANLPKEELILDEWTRRLMIVPLDGSSYAEAVLPHVEMLAKQRGAASINIVLFRVYEQPYVNADYPEPGWEEHVRQMNQHFKEDAERYLAKIQARLAGAGLNVRTETVSGDAAEEIIKFTQKNHPNLLVMATHGTSGISRWEYGDIVDKVIRGVTSPVFLVRPVTEQERSSSKARQGQILQRR